MSNTIRTERFHSNGKLLLTGEFLVIDGAKALALPCKYGQSMKVAVLGKPEIHWKSYTSDGRLWYEDYFRIDQTGIQLKEAFTKQTVEHTEMAQRLKQLLNVLFDMQPGFFIEKGYSVETHLEFPKEWGLGSSSTLLANLAQWVGINPYELSAQTFGGSAYDIACAMSHSPLSFQWTAAEHPKVEQVDFLPEFKEDLFFVYQNHKQNTRDRVKHYHQLNPGDKSDWVKKASGLTEAFINCKNRIEFESLIEIHEQLLSKVLAMPPVKQLRFEDYSGAVKSLGAWGGDFVIATGTDADRAYFKQKGYHTIISYKDMVL